MRPEGGGIFLDTPPWGPSWISTPSNQLCIAVFFAIFKNLVKRWNLNRTHGTVARKEKKKKILKQTFWLAFVLNFMLCGTSKMKMEDEMISEMD